MENFNPSPFLVAWHNAMLYGAIGMFAAAIIYYVFHLVKITTIQSYKDKYDYISRREIKNLEITFVLIAIGIAMLINRYGMDQIENVSVVFFVRLFIAIAGGTLVGYIAFL